MGQWEGLEVPGSGAEEGGKEPPEGFRTPVLGEGAELIPPPLASFTLYRKPRSSSTTELSL